MFAYMLYYLYKKRLANFFFIVYNNKDFSFVNGLLRFYGTNNRR